VIRGDSVSDVLGYLEYDKLDLSNGLRAAAEKALRRGEIAVEDVRSLMEQFDAGLSGYTYLEED